LERVSLGAHTVQNSLTKITCTTDLFLLVQYPQNFFNRDQNLKRKT